MAYPAVKNLGPDRAQSPLTQKSPTANPRATALGFLAVSLCVFLVQTLFIYFYKLQFHFSQEMDALVDAASLLVVMTPLLYFLFVRPMAKIIQQKSSAERSLQVACEELEARVRSRTADLESLTHSLQEEITHKVRAMMRLQLHGSLLDTVQQGVLATGAEGTIIYWNRFAEELFGWSQNEAKGRTLAELALFPAELLTGYLADPAGARGWEAEVPITRQDGFAFPAHLTCSPMWKPDCTIGGTVYTFIDITDRKEAEATIRSSEERYSTVVESSPTGICLFQNDQFVFANRRFLEIVERPKEDLESHRPAEVIHAEDWPRVEEKWHRRFECAGTLEDYEFRILTPGGTIRWLSGRSAIIFVNGRKALLVNVQDVTERHEALQALQESREILRSLSTSLITAQEAERKRIAQELHDGLGQSLSAIKFVVERALVQGSGDDSAGALTTIRGVIPVIKSTMEEVRRVSMDLRPSTLDDLGLLATIRWFAREFQTTYPEIQTELEIGVEEAQIPEHLKTHVFRILQEAMNNAAKYSHAKRIRLALKRLEDRLELRIQDDGVGFDPSQAKRADVHGGLGLSSMRERAQLFGGHCTIDSAPGAGTTVSARWLVGEILFAGRP